MYPNKKLTADKRELLNLNVKYTYSAIPRNTNLGNYIEIDKVKNKIEKVDQTDWTRVRKYTNKYEAPLYNSPRKVISRAFYKLWELMHDYNIQCNGETLHLCDAPGGFIQAVIDYKTMKYNNIKKCHTISLTHKTDLNVPRYHQLIKNNVNVNILNEYNGDITNPNTHLSILKSLNGKAITFVSADGGMTENGDYNNKENIHTQLILCQVFTTCLVLQQGGSFILKIFDIYTDATVHIIYLLMTVFDTVEIVKPLTSRPTNSEKYLVCKGYHKEFFSTSMKNSLYRCIKIMYDNPLLNIYKLFDDVVVYDVFDRLYNDIYSYNTDFITQQIKHIETNLNLLKTKKSSNYTYNYRNQFSKEWLLKYKLIR